MRLSPGAPVSQSISQVKCGEVIMAMVFVGIAIMVVFNLPSPILDTLIVISIGVSLLLFIVSLYIRDPLQFSAYPTIVLITTLFRFAVFLSGVRMILFRGAMSDGGAADGGTGKVIIAFAHCAAGENVIVGLILIVILALVQYVVIRNGAQRISSMTARFTLDAMPGKQMAIDADFHSGLIDTESARQRRRHIEREADFFGSMDGVGKLIKMESIASIVLMIGSVIAGLIIGHVRHMTPGQALMTYVSLSLGNGLAATISAFLVSMALGTVISKIVSEHELGSDLAYQVTSQSWAYYGLALFLTILGVINLIWKSALPDFPYFLLAEVLACVERLLNKKTEGNADSWRASTRERASGHPEGEEMEGALTKPRDSSRFSIYLFLGRDLAYLADPLGIEYLPDRFNYLRQELAEELGFHIPSVNIRTSLDIPHNGYLIQFNDVTAGSGEVIPNHLLVSCPTQIMEELPGIRTIHPVSCRPALWINPRRHKDVRFYNLPVSRADQVITSHVAHLARIHRADLLSLDQVRAMVSELLKRNPSFFPRHIAQEEGFRELHKVLQTLMRDRMPVNDLWTIVTAADAASLLRHEPEMLAEHARIALSQSLLTTALGKAGKAGVLALDWEIEELIERHSRGSDKGLYAALEPLARHRILMAIGKKVEGLLEQGTEPVLLCAAEVRRQVRTLTEHCFPELVVLSWSEISPEIEVDCQGFISLDGRAA
jgi:flagellar biosynthesis protein FlhA